MKTLFIIFTLAFTTSIFAMGEDFQDCGAGNSEILKTYSLSSDSIGEEASSSVSQM